MKISKPDPRSIDQEGIWTLREIAYHMRLSQKITKQMIDDLALPATRIRGTYFTTRTALARWVELQMDVEKQLKEKEPEHDDLRSRKNSSLLKKTPSRTYWPTSWGQPPLNKNSEIGRELVLINGGNWSEPSASS